MLDASALLIVLTGCHAFYVDVDGRAARRTYDRLARRKIACRIA